MPRRSLPWRRASTTHASLAAVEAADVSKRFRPIERVQGCSTRRRERRTVNRVTPNGESLRTVDLPDTTGLSGAHLRTTEWRGSRPGGAAARASGPGRQPARPDRRNFAPAVAVPQDMPPKENARASIAPAQEERVLRSLRTGRSELR